LLLINKYRFLFTFFFLATSSVCTADQLDVEIIAEKTNIINYTHARDSLFEKISKQMDIEFFKKLISKKNINPVNDLAQIEDFDNQSLPLISDAMFILLQKNEFNKMSVFKEDIHKLSLSIQKLSAKKKVNGIEKWRELFLDKLSDYMRYLSELKPKWKLSLNTMITHDTNVNNLPDEETPFNHSHKKDFQYFQGTSFTWLPWVNNKEMKKSKNFFINVNQVWLSHRDYKENDIFSLNIEPKYIKHIGSTIDEIAIAYKAQYLGISKHPTSSSFSDFFHNHRLKLFFDLEDSMPLFDWIKSTKIKFSISRSLKIHFDTFRKNSDAIQTTAEANQSLTYGSKNVKSINFNFKYKTYKTKASAASNNTTFNYSMSHSHSLRFKILNKKIRFNEHLTLVKRKFSQFLGGEQVERNLKTGLGINVQLNAKLNSSLRWHYSIKKSAIITEILDPISDEAKQHRTTLGFSLKI